MHVVRKPLTFLDLGEKYVDYYLSGVFTEKMIAQFAVIRECLYECYKSLVNNKRLLAFEEWDFQHKADLYFECNKYWETLSLEDVEKFNKAYAALAFLMEKRL